MITAFPPAGRDSSERGLAAHGMCQTQDVCRRFGFGTIGNPADAAVRRAKTGTVNPDDRLEAGAIVLNEDDFLEIARLHRFENRESRGFAGTLIDGHGRGSPPLRHSNLPDGHDKDNHVAILKSDNSWLEQVGALLCLTVLQTAPTIYAQVSMRPKAWQRESCSAMQRN